MLSIWFKKLGAQEDTHKLLWCYLLLHNKCECSLNEEKWHSWNWLTGLCRGPSEWRDADDVTCSFGLNFRGRLVAVGGDPSCVLWPHVFLRKLFLRKPHLNIHITFCFARRSKEGKGKSQTGQGESHRRRLCFDLSNTHHESAIIMRPPLPNLHFTMTTKTRKTKKLNWEDCFSFNISNLLWYVREKISFVNQFLCFSHLCRHRKTRVLRRRPRDDCRFLTAN